MTAGSLRSIYQQYKFDTDVVASWLATTATSFGYSAPLGPESAKSSARLKGKARKAAKAASATKTSDSAPKVKYTLAVKDFGPLATHIASLKDKAIEIPEYLSEALERVIQVRSSFSQKLEAAGKVIDQASDSRHVFFVSVLEQVRDSLKPLLSANAFNFTGVRNAVPKTNATEKDRKRNSPLRNLFEVLDVYEPTAEFLAAPDVAPPPKRSELEATVELPQDDIFEIYFATTALMDDLSRLRAEVAELWAKHHAGKIDLAAVSVATNTAMDIAHSLEAELQPVLKHITETQPWHDFYFAAIGHTYGIDINVCNPGRGEDYNMKAYDIADALFINARFAMAIYINNEPSTPKGRAEMSYNGKFGWFDEKARPTSNMAKYLRDKATLQELLQDLALFYNNPGVFEDQLIHGLVAARNSPQLTDKDGKGRKQPPIWFCFAAQVYLDILYSTKVGAGWTEMADAISSYKSYLTRYSKECPNLSKTVESVKHLNEADPIALIRRASGKPYKDYVFFRRNPTYCGLWIHYARSVFHQDAVTYAAAPGGVMVTTQLYHALQHAKLLRSQWEDLETLWKTQGDKAYFVGDAPTEVEALFRNYCICLGMSVTNWASNKRDKKDKKPKINKKNLPDMTWQGPVSRWIASRIATLGDQRLVTAGDLQEQVEKLHPSSIPSNRILTKLSLTIEAEIPAFTFDYFLLHDQCLRYLELLRDALDPVIADKSLKQWTSQKQNLPIVVGFVFSAAAGRPDIEMKIPGGEVLRLAAKVMEDHLDAVHAGEELQNSNDA